MDVKKPLLDVVKKSVVIKIDLKGLAHGLVDECLEPALKEVVAKTPNQFDDAAMAMVYPTLEVELKKLIDAKLEKVQAQIDEQLAKVLG